MKELSIEQKAKAYDELIKRLNKAREDVGGYTFKSVYDEVMSELAESEDEKIRKDILTYLLQSANSATLKVNAQKFNKWIAWLEKQGKNNMGISEATKRELEDNLNKALEQETPDSLNKFLEKQDEQKPSDNQFTPEQANILDKHIDKFIEQKPAWSEEDEKKLLCVCAWIKDYPRIADFKDEMYTVANNYINWLESLRDRVQPQQEWSEEDEKIRQDTIRVLEEGRDKYIRNSGCFPSWSKSISWLKSLRPNYWKPSEEQLNALHWCVMNVGSTEHQVLQELLEQLEKLKD